MLSGTKLRRERRLKAEARRRFAKRHAQKYNFEQIYECPQARQQWYNSFLEFVVEPPPSFTCIECRNHTKLAIAWLSLCVRRSFIRSSLCSASDKLLSLLYEVNKVERLLQRQLESCCEDYNAGRKENSAPLSVTLPWVSLFLLHLPLHSRSISMDPYQLQLLRQIAKGPSMGVENDIYTVPPSFPTHYHIGPNAPPPTSKEIHTQCYRWMDYGVRCAIYNRVADDNDMDNEPI